MLTLEQRVKRVEKKVEALARGLAKTPKGKKDWRATIGLSKNDAGFEEMIRLGRKYRQSSGNGSNRAHS